MPNNLHVFEIVWTIFVYANHDKCRYEIKSYMMNELHTNKTNITNIKIEMSKQVGMYHTE